MSLIISENSAEQPITEGMFYTAQQQLTPCLQVRDAKWRYSLLSSDGSRWICTYHAPDAQSIRDAYRRVGYVARRAWAGDLIQPQHQRPISVAGQRIVLEETYPYLGEEELNHTKNELLRWDAEHGIKWICSYLSSDRTRLISNSSRLIWRRFERCSNNSKFLTIVSGLLKFSVPKTSLGYSFHARNALGTL